MNLFSILYKAIRKFSNLCIEHVCFYNQDGLAVVYKSKVKLELLSPLYLGFNGLKHGSDRNVYLYVCT